MRSSTTPTARHSGLVVQEYENEVLVYDLLSHKAIYLNQTSAAVWRECNGKNGLAEIAESLSKQSGCSVPDDVVWLALDQLSKNELLVEPTGLKDHFRGLSRREVMRRIGLTTAVALPIIGAIVAPKAAHAQSGAGACQGGICFCLNATGTAGEICPTTLGGACQNPSCVCQRSAANGDQGSCI